MFSADSPLRLKRSKAISTMKMMKVTLQTKFLDQIYSFKHSHILQPRSSLLRYPQGLLLINRYRASFSHLFPLNVRLQHTLGDYFLTRGWQTCYIDLPFRNRLVLTKHHPATTVPCANSFHSTLGFGKTQMHLHLDFSDFYTR